MLRFLCILLIMLPLGIQAQTISGKVSNADQEGLAGANVYWINTSQGTLTNEDGEFRLSAADISDRRLIISYVGFASDTVNAVDEERFEIVLEEAGVQDEVLISEKQDGIIISDLNPVKTEIISRTELEKSSCCDLAGCFETQTTVQPQVTNVLTNSRELRILGLSGVYNQVLIDGFPLIQGLTFTYGISGIPGTMVDNIYVSKGANSVLQGFESISGQINVETIEPGETDKLLLNAYVNSFGEKHLNANYSFGLGKWNSLAGLHVVQPAGKIDRDDDDFLDLPLLTRYMAFNKWSYGQKDSMGLNFKVGLRYLDEKRTGGQELFDPKKDQGSMEIYGQSVTIHQPELWSRTGYRFNSNNAIFLFLAGNYQDQESWFGTVRYRANQLSAYSNLQYEYNYGVHDLKAGISYRHFDLKQNISFTDTFGYRNYAGDYNNFFSVPGVFAENTMNFFDNRMTWIAGVRLDRCNDLTPKLTPRTMVKIDLFPKTVIRANIGTGWRNVNLFSENIMLMVSSRDVVFEEKLNPEEAINYGGNITQKFENYDGSFSGYFSADIYHTEFLNQVFPDYYTDPKKAIIRNFTGKSVSNGFQAEVSLNLWSRIGIKSGYNYLDVYRMNGDIKELLPFNPKHKVLATLSYKPLTEKFHVDLNMHWYGKRRLPDTRSNPVEYQRPDYSKSFALLNMQFTYSFGKLEAYTGCENIFDFRQRRPIISWQDPFGPYFDTSSVWGPTRGREFYLGLRFRLK